MSDADDAEHLGGGRGISRRWFVGGLTALSFAALMSEFPAVRASAATGFVQPFTDPLPGITTSFEELDRLDWDPPEPEHRHKGTDYGLGASGRYARAIGAGTVTTAGWDNEYGNNVIIQHADSITSRYGHFAPGTLSVVTGQSVSAGQNLGIVGHTGYATGDHLHLEIRVNGTLVDPVNFLIGATGSSATNKSGDNEMLLLTKAGTGPTFAFALIGPGFWYDWVGLPSAGANGMLAQIAGNTTTGGVVVTDEMWNALKAEAHRTATVTIAS